MHEQVLHLIEAAQRPSTSIQVIGLDVGAHRGLWAGGFAVADFEEVGAGRKATRSGGNGGECVEVATADTEIAVRDSKDPAGPNLSFTPSAWGSFLARAATRP